MNAKRLLLALWMCLFAGGLSAAPDTTKGTWYGTDGTDGTLRGRDPSGKPINLLVGGTLNPALTYVYDTQLDLTWLADWNAAKGSGFDNVGSAAGTGYLVWAQAHAWAASLSDFGGGWALPWVVINPVSLAISCTFGWSGTDCGYNVYGSEAARRVSSPLAHMYYDTLGNLGLYDALGAPQSGGGISNTGPFSNLQTTVGPGVYWSGIEFPQYQVAGSFYMYDGYQGTYSSGGGAYAVAVRSGDILVAVPEPGTYAMQLAGLGLVGAMLRRRHPARSSAA